MALVYWFADGVGRGVNNGGADGRTPIPTIMVRWMRSHSPSLIVNGGDVYGSGDSSHFAKFYDQVDRDVRLMCETAGNHDWDDDVQDPNKGLIPHGLRDVLVTASRIETADRCGSERRRQIRPLHRPRGLGVKASSADAVPAICWSPC